MEEEIRRILKRAVSGAASTEAVNTPTPVDEDVAPGNVYPGAVTQQGAPPPGRSPDAGGYFQSPARDTLPDGPFGEVVARGGAIFENTNAHRASSKYVGNDQACGNCHIDAERLARSAPLWASRDGNGAICDVPTDSPQI